MLEIAQLWIHAGLPDRAFMSALIAARAAESIGAQGERAVMLGEALRLWSHVSSTVRAEHDLDDLTEQAIWACTLSRRVELGLQILARLMKSRDASEDKDLRALRLALARDRFAQDIGPEDTHGAHLLLEEQVALLRRSPRSLLFAHAVSDLVANSDDIETSTMLHELLTDALAIAEDQGTFFDHVDLQDSRTHHLKVLGRLDEAANHSLGLLRDYGGRLLLSDLMRLESNTVARLFDVGRFAEAAAIGRRSMLRLPDPRLSPETWSALAANLAATLIETGDWADAARYLADIDALGIDTIHASAAQLDAVLLACRRGDLNAANQGLEAAAESGGAPSTLTKLSHYRGLVDAEVALSTGNPRTAWAQLAPVWTVSSSRDVVVTRSAQLLAARTLAAARQPYVPKWAAPFDKRVRDLQEAADQLPSGVWQPVWRVRFEVELARCLGRDTQELWEQVITETKRVGQPYEQALALLGLTYRALSDHSAPVARDALGQAHAIAERLGSGILKGAVREASSRGRIALDDTGSSPRKSPTTYGLTERELEVLRLVADGYRNDEIGDALFISPKTASVHVSRILTKLGVTSRGAASALAHREGLLADTGN